MIKKLEIETDLLFARPVLDGDSFTWTLASRLGHILRQAEVLYGLRDSTYTILGVEFGGDAPQIWFPGNCGHVIVQITSSCATDIVRACYQMAHECVHLLSPVAKQQITILEEGLGTHFSHRYIREQLRAISWLGDEPESYRSACLLVEELLALDPGIIRSVRQRQPKISCVTTDDLRAACTNVTAELARALTQVFIR